MDSRNGTMVGSTRTILRSAGRVPVRSYVPAAGLPSVFVAHWSPDHPFDTAAPQSTHAHDFLQLLYVESGQHHVRIDDIDWVLDAGDMFVIAPGAVIATKPAPGLSNGNAWTVVFPVDALESGASASSWRAHPLLSAFALSSRASGYRLRVPAEAQPLVLAKLTDLDGELRDRRDWHADAVRAHLSLLLVQLNRLGLETPGAQDTDPLLAAVFDVIESRFHEPISLNDIASAVSQSSGYLTTLVGDRTGRTVGQWIAERRMREARRLLIDTDLTISEIATRVGYLDAGYFTRRFRASHQQSPRAWRRAGR